MSLSMQIFKDIFSIYSFSIILYLCDTLYIPSINLNWIKFSSIVCSSYPSFSNSQYLFTFRRWWKYFIIGLSFSCFSDMDFVLSATTNLFLGLVFLMIWLIFQKSGLPGNSQWKIHLNSLLHLCKLGKLICQYH